jgi:hypothetical protein
MALVKLLSLAVAAAAIIPLTVFCFDHPQVNDFRSFHRGSAALTSHHLAGLYHEQRYASLPLNLPFVRPPAYALILAPLSYLPLTAAFCLWVAIQSGVFLYFLFQAQSTARKSAVACLFPPVVLGICHGQDCTLFLGVLVAGYALLRRHKDFPGGIVLGLGLLKFHLFVMWPIALAAQRRWRALAGFCLVGAGIAAVSFALVGMEGIRDYCALLTSPALTSSTPGLAREVGIEGLLANLNISSLPLSISIGLGLATLAVFFVRRKGLEWLFVILPAVSLAIAPHALYYDPTILLLPMWLVLSFPGARLLQAVAIVLASPLVFIAPTFPAPWSAASSIGLLVFLFAALWRIATQAANVQAPPPVAGPTIDMKNACPAFP